MRIYFDLDQIPNLKLNSLFIDTSALINIVNNKILFNDFSSKLKELNCSLISIPAVVFEFTGTDSIDTYNLRASFIKQFLVTIYPIERQINRFSDLRIILHHLCKDLSYPDFLLYCCLYQFKKSYLLTADHGDFTTNILDRVSVLTMDNGKDIKNLGFYTFSSVKYEKAAASILKKINK